MVFSGTTILLQSFTWVSGIKMCQIKFPGVFSMSGSLERVIDSLAPVNVCFNPKRMLISQFSTCQSVTFSRRILFAINSFTPSFSLFCYNRLLQQVISVNHYYKGNCFVNNEVQYYDYNMHL